VVFKDITPLLADHTGFGQVVEALAAAGKDDDGNPVVDKVVGIEARGFILAAPVALALGAGFVPVRKKGKLPAATYEESYALEYGEATIEVHQDAFTPGDRVLVIDDVLATGGTVEACLRLIRRCGAEVVGTAVLLELSFLPGRKRLEGETVTSLLTV
jgi:adenine phosphoribosyltransferase